MPNIPTYTPNLPEIQPSDVGPETAASAGRRISGVFHEEGEQLGHAIAGVGGPVQIAANALEQEQGRQEITKGIAQSAQANMGLEQQYNAYLKANPNDPNAGAKFFQDQVMPTFSAMADQYGTKAGQEFAQRQIESYGRYWQQKTIADAATLAGHQAVNNLSITANALGASVQQSGGDSHALDFALEQFKASADNLAGAQNLAPGVLDEHVKTIGGQLVAAAIQTQAQKPGGEAAARAMLNDPKYAPYLGLELRPQLENYITHEQKQIETQSREDSKNAVSDWVSNTLTNPDGTYRLWTAKDIGALKSIPGIRPEDVRTGEALGVTLFRRQEQERQGLLLGKASIDDHATVAKDILRLGDPNNPLTLQDIAKQTDQQLLTTNRAMEFAGKVSPTKTPILTQINQNPLVKAELDRANAAIQGNLNNEGMPVVKSRQEQFRTDTLRTLQGIALADPTNPHAIDDYVNPKSPNYLFSDDRVRQYIPTDKEAHASMVIAPAAAKAQEKAPLTDAQKANMLNAIHNKVYGPAQESDEALKAKGGT